MLMTVLLDTFPPQLTPASLAASTARVASIMLLTAHLVLIML